MKSELEALRHKINERFVRAFATYHLIEDGDHILVGLSGGKDSLCLLELLARRARIAHPQFTLEAVHVRMENIRYETSTDYLDSICKEWGVKLHVVTTRFEVGDIDNSQSANANRRRQKSPCFLCSWNRRKQLFNLAQQLGCNKIALGHHQDDIISTALMNLTFQGRFGTMPARLKMRKMPITIIRPLCMVEEADIAKYAEMSQYEKQITCCPYEHDSNRTAIRQLFEDVACINPEARQSIWNALKRDGKLTEDI